MNSELNRASFLSRFIANAIDSFIAGLLMATVIGIGLGLIYSIFRDSFQILNYQSIGKKIVGIRVITFNEFESPYKLSLKRHWYTWIPLFAIIDGIILLSKKNNKRVGDVWANTMVVVDEKDLSNKFNFKQYNIDNNEENVNKKQSWASLIGIKIGKLIFKIYSFIRKYYKYLLATFIIIISGILIIIFITIINENKWEEKINNLRLKSNMQICNNIDHSVYHVDKNLGLRFKFDWEYLSYESSYRPQLIINHEVKNQSDTFNITVVFKSLDNQILYKNSYNTGNIFPGQNKEKNIYLLKENNFHKKSYSSKFPILIDLIIKGKNTNKEYIDLHLNEWDWVFGEHNYFFYRHYRKCNKCQLDLNSE